ncbi:hypothetical protein BH24CHL10_BH24CHL10_09590 [soil metagenome]
MTKVTIRRATADDGSNNEEGQPNVRYAWGDARYDRSMNNDRS